MVFMKNNITLATFFKLSEYPAISNALQIEPALEAVELSTIDDGINFINTTARSVLVINLKTKDDLVYIIKLFKESNKTSNQVKFIVVDYARNLRFYEILSKLGLPHFIDLRVNFKAIRFKLDYVIKTFKESDQKNLNPKNGIKFVASSAEVDSNQNLKVPEWLPALDIMDDIWILKNEIDCKTLMNKWVVKMMGPSPHAGNFHSTQVMGTWEFRFKNGKEYFSRGNGKWLFKGEKKPDFLWDENRWNFRSDYYELYYQTNNSIHLRFQVKENVLKIAANSSHALQKEDLIIKSFDENFLYQIKSASFGNEKYDDDYTPRKLEDLKGKGNTEHLASKPLSGEIDTDKLSSKLLELNVKKQNEHNSSNDYSEARTINPELNLDLETTNYEKLRGKSKTENINSDSSTNDFPFNAPNSKLLTLDIDRKNTPNILNLNTSLDTTQGTRSREDLTNLEEKFANQTPHPIEAKSDAGKEDSIDKAFAPGALNSERRETKAQTEKENEKKGLGNKNIYLDDLSREKKKKTSRKDGSQNGSLNADSEKPQILAINKAGKAAAEKDFHDAELDKPKNKKRGDNDNFQEAPKPTKGFSELFLEKQNVLPLLNTSPIHARHLRAIDSRKKNSKKDDKENQSFIEEIFLGMNDNPKLSIFMTQGEQTVTGVFDDYFDKKLMIYTSSNNIVTQKTLNLSMNLTYMGKDLVCYCDVLVLEVSKIEENIHLLTMELTPKTVKSFEKFIKVFQARQKSISLFLDQARGF
jgi:hypothetical protein